MKIEKELKKYYNTEVSGVIIPDMIHTGNEISWRAQVGRVIISDLMLKAAVHLGIAVILFTAFFYRQEEPVLASLFRQYGLELSRGRSLESGMNYLSDKIRKISEYN